MPTESKLGIVLGLGLLILSVVSAARPGFFGQPSHTPPSAATSYSNSNDTAPHFAMP
ncbi:MAG: hypothetical protein ACJ8C4_14860 [Gemmataceae bacterium]